MYESVVLERRCRALVGAGVADAVLAGERGVGYDAGAGPGHDPRVAGADGGVCGGGGDVGAGGVAAAIAGVQAAVAALAAVDLDGEEDRALLDAAVALQQVSSQLAGAALPVVGEAERRGAYGLDGAATMAAWYRGRTRLDHAEASRWVVTARRLGRFPRLAEALAAGQVSMSHAAVITAAAIPRRADAVAACEEVLVELAGEASPSVVRQALRVIADQVDPDASDPNEPLAVDGPDERRALDHHRGIDGLGQVQVTMDPLAYEAFLTLLDAFATLDPADTPQGRRRSAAQRRADALAAAVDAALAAGAAPTVGGVKPHITAAVDLLALLGLDPDTLAAMDEPARAAFLDALARMFTPDHHDHHDDDTVDEAGGADGAGRPEAADAAGGSDRSHLHPPRVTEPAPRVTEPAPRVTGPATRADDAVRQERGPSGRRTRGDPGAAGGPSPPPRGRPPKPPVGPAPGDGGDGGLAAAVRAAGDAAADPAVRARRQRTRQPRMRHTGVVDIATVRRLAYHASLSVVLTMGPWRVVSVGRKHRTLPPWLRIVLDLVHGHCRGPDCDRSISWSQGHHVIRWDDGGDTDLNASIPLCTKQHILTETGWTVRFNPDTGECTWTSPDGNTITTHPPTP